MLDRKTNVCLESDKETENKIKYFMEIDFFRSNSSRSVETRLSKLRTYRDIGSVLNDYDVFGYDYFDNPELGIGYGGYTYDGRFAEAVQRMCEHYELQPGSRILEIGCAKGFILVEFQKAGMQVAGVDASTYAMEHAHPDVQTDIQVGSAATLEFDADTFDFVFGKEVLPHVPADQLRQSIGECMRVSKGPVFFEIQTGDTSDDLELIRQWDPTHTILEKPIWWLSIFEEMHFKGDWFFKKIFART